jgi:signal transduction histidine kinase
LRREAGGVSNPRFGAEQMIATLLAQLREFYDAEVCLLVTNTAVESGSRLHCCERHHRDNEVREEFLSIDLENALLWLPRDVLAVYDRGRRRWWGLAPSHPKSAEWQKDGHLDQQVTRSTAAVESLLTRFDGRSWLSVPAYFGQHWLGRLHIVSTNPLHASDAEFAQQVLETGMVVVENIRLVDQLASSAAERERQRLARDIHDSVIQPYIGLQLGLSAVQRTLKSGNSVGARKEVSRLLELTGMAIDDLRAGVGGLKSEPAAGGNNLLPALRRYASQFAQDTGIVVDVAGGDAARRRDRLDAELFQMAVEALSNVRRHTAATRAAIRLVPDDGHITLQVVQVENQEAPDVQRQTFTPVSISERAAALGGHVTVDRQRDGRTIVEIKVPL